MSLFAANRGTGAGPSNVVVFDTATGKLIQRIPVEVNPYALVLSDNGQSLYVSNWGSDSVSVVDVNTLRVVGRIARSRPGKPGGPPASFFAASRLKTSFRVRATSVASA